jgi:hypothetical protein
MNWQDTVMTYEQIERKFAMTPEEVMWQWLSKSQAQLSFEAGEQSRTRLIADLRETVNRMMADNSELVVKLEHERQEGMQTVVDIIVKQGLVGFDKWFYSDWQEQKAKWLKEAQHG